LANKSRKVAQYFLRNRDSNWHRNQSCQELEVIMRRKNVMLARPFDAKRLAKWPKPYILQPKINGRRALAVFDSLGYCFLRSSEGHLINSLPTLQSSLDSLGLKDVTLDGELYVHGWTKQQIDRIVGRSATIHAEEAWMQYHVFDMVNDQPQFARIRQLHHIKFGRLRRENILAVDSINHEDIPEALEWWLEQGYEGIIIRHREGLYQPCNEKARSDYLMKLKPRKTLRVRVVGKLEEYSIYNEPKYALGAYQCQAPNGERFKVGTGFTREQRENYWLKPTPEWLTLYYQELSERGVPIFPVFKEVI
jgi:ATP-dependent DNA ligase